MSTFYGTVSGAAASKATRTGTRNSGITVSAQSWHGSLIVELDEQKDGTPVFTLYVADCSTDKASQAIQIFSGTQADLEKALSL